MLTYKLIEWRKLARVLKRTPVSAIHMTPAMQKASPLIIGNGSLLCDHKYYAVGTHIDTMGFLVSVTFTRPKRYSLFLVFGAPLAFLLLS